MRRVSAILLSLCLMLSLTTPVLAAPKTSGAASTLRLESTEGTVQMKDAAGKTITAKKGARLYNGYHLSTQKASYAFVSLDSSKAVKLDASTSATVFQSGKKLELTATSGQLFFNVTAPLKSNESLNIRTSTMVTGVRGTCGWVEISDRNTTRLSLLEGTLTVTSPDPVTGEARTITIQGGQTLTIVYEGTGHGFDPSLIGDNITIQDLIDQGIIIENNIILTGTGLTVEALQEENVPGFVAVEVTKDKELQKKIEETTNLSVPAIIEDAEKRLSEEEAAANQADQEIQNALENLSADDTDPLFEDAAEESSGGGGGGNAAPAPVRGVVNATSDTTAALNEELRQAAAAGNDVVVSNTVSAGNDRTPVVVQPDQTMTLANGAALDGGVYDVQGTLAVEDGATAENSGEIAVNSTNSLEISGTLVNNGVIYIGDTAPGALRILSGGQLINNGSIYVGSETTANATGLLEIQAGGSLTTEGDSILQVGSYEETGATGTMTVASGATVTCGVDVTERGTMTNDGTINAYVSNAGTATNNGTISGYITNEGTFTNNRTIDGVVTNYNTLNHYGTLTTNMEESPIDMQGGTLNITNARVESAGLSSESGIGIPAIAVWCASGTINISGSTITATGIAIKDSTYAAKCTINIKNGSTVTGLLGGIDSAFEASTTVDSTSTVGDGSALATYTVTFYGNAADASYQSATETFTGGISQILRPQLNTGATQILRPGYTQTGWNTEPDGSGTSHEMDQSFIATEDLNLYAQWKINSFTVHFDLNGGSGTETPESLSVNYGDPVTMPTIQPTKANMHFLGWSDSYSPILVTFAGNGGDIIYKPGETTTGLDMADGEELILYAAWADYRVEYTANAADADGTMAPSYHFGADYSLIYTPNGFTRSGWCLNDWALDPDGTYRVGPGNFRMSSFESMLSEAGIDASSGVVTLYACWWPVITYDPNGGTGEMPPTKLADPGVGTSVASCGFTREGYTFLCWNTQADGLGTAYDPSKGDAYPPTDGTTPVTLYAQWKANTP